MTSVEIPVSIAAALPNLTVLDITNDVRREVAATGGSGLSAARSMASMGTFTGTHPPRRDPSDDVSTIQ